MKKEIYFFIGLIAIMVLVSGCIKSNTNNQNQNNQNNLLSNTNGVEVCTAEGGAQLTVEEALAIANDSVCVQEGAVKSDCSCNETTGTCWLDMEVEGHEGCNPACVVNLETKEAEVNWRCTGLIPE